MAALMPYLRKKYNVIEIAIGASASLAFKEIQESGNVIIPTAGDNGVALGGQYYGQDIVRKLVQDMKQNNATPKFVLVNHDLQCLTFIAQIFKNHNIPLIYWFLQDNDHITIKHLSYLSIPDKIIYQTNYSRDMVYDHCPVYDGPVIYPSINTDTFKDVNAKALFKGNESMKKLDGKKVIFFNGKNQRRKNLQCLIKAIKILQDRAIDNKKMKAFLNEIVFLVHSPSTRETTQGGQDGGKDAAETLDMSDYLWGKDISPELLVMNKEPVPDEIINAWYEIADLLVIPSCSEGFGMIFLEAFHKKIPIISVNYSATAEVVGKDRGYLIDPKLMIFQPDKECEWAYIDQEELADAIYYVMNIDTISYVENGRKWIKKYNAGAQAAKMIEQFELVVKDHAKYVNQVPVQLII